MRSPSDNVRTAASIVIAAALAIAVGFDEGAWMGIAALAFVAGLAGIVHWGRARGSYSVAVLSGRGDERATDLYVGACARTMSVLGFVLVGWILVSTAQGNPNETVGQLCAIGGLAFIANVAWALVDGPNRFLPAWAHRTANEEGPHS